MNIEEQKLYLDDLDNGPLVSIIIPVFNAEKHLAETIHSVQEQTYNNWELLIIDNCSDDNTLQIISSYTSSKIRVFRTECNSGGPALPRNIGIKNANGEYLAFLDADDLWSKNKLEIQLFYLKKEDFVCSLATRIDEEGNVIAQGERIDNKHYQYCDLVKRNRIINSSVMISRDKFLPVLFDEDAILNGIEDYHAYLTYAFNKGSVFLIGEPLIKYRVLVSSLGESISGKKRLAKSSYCLTKVVLTNGAYDCYIYGMIRRLLSYFKCLLKK